MGWTHSRLLQPLLRFISSLPLPPNDHHYHHHHKGNAHTTKAGQLTLQCLHYWLLFNLELLSGLGRGSTHYHFCPMQDVPHLKPYSVLPFNYTSCHSLLHVALTTIHIYTGYVNVAVWVDIWSRTKGMSVQLYTFAMNHLPSWSFFILDPGPKRPTWWIVFGKLFLMLQIWKDYSETILALTAISDEL